MRSKRQKEHRGEKLFEKVHSQTGLRMQNRFVLLQKRKSNDKA